MDEGRRRNLADEVARLYQLARDYSDTAEAIEDRLDASDWRPPVAP